jgi:hypothetical protein
MKSMYKNEIEKGKATTTLREKMLLKHNAMDNQGIAQSMSTLVSLKS